MKIAFYGSSILSSYWNGAATYYRGMLRALAQRGYDITFFEPDAHGRQQHRDIDPPDWCKVHVYEASPAAMRAAAARAGEADIVVKASGVGYEDDALFALVLDSASAQALKVFWDVDAPATLAGLAADPAAPLHGHLARTGLVLTYGGGDPVVYGYRKFGVTECHPVYNALDPSTHFRVAPDQRFACDLAFLGNRLPDREARVEDFFLAAAAARPSRRFLIGGAGWDDKAMPPNVQKAGHVGTADHNAFNSTPLTVLNISRADMAANGFSPATRVFEAAGAAACIITDPWAGMDLFLTPGEEILVARDGQDVADI
ncbi:MAG: glycosyltransferase, partial [Nitratireductor sp.]|nr:glycosyltransferase [Nitratireductor sp.]